MKTKSYNQLIVGLFSIFLTLPSYAQDKFSQKATDVGNIGITFSNNGIFGNAFAGIFNQGVPSVEYPIGSGIEHIFEGGLWVGALVNGESRVTTGSPSDDSNGYGPGDEGYEFTVDTLNQLILERSSLSDSKYLSPYAVSHQDFIAHFTDKNTKIPGLNLNIPNHTKPLGIDVTQESYAWSFEFTDYFVIVSYKIKNTGTDTLKNIYAGIWADFVIRNVKVTAPRGSAFFSAHGNQIIDTLWTTYGFDSNGDPGFTDSYAGVSLLGSFLGSSFKSPKTDPTLGMNYNFWGFRGADPNALAPISENERYQKLSSSSTPSQIASYKAPGNRSALISVGPYSQLNPGETLEVVFAITCARKSGTQAASLDLPEQKEEFVTNIGWAKRTFEGEDRNGNGILDLGEDTNGNGVLDRYIVPTPPSSPRVKTVPGDGYVDVYWDQRAEFSVDPISGEQDFEGYKIYKTNQGDEQDLTTSLNNKLQLAAQFDLVNGLGFDTGLNSRQSFTNLVNTPIQFSDDTVKYRYKYRFGNLKNGWLYNFSVTAFDRGDTEKEIPPLESPVRTGARLAFPGTASNPDFVNGDPFVYPNPFYVKAKWDGSGDVNHRLHFANLPARAKIIIFSLSGEKIIELLHEGNIDSDNRSRWFDTFGARNAQSSGGEHAWNIISTGNQNVSSGLYIFTVEDLSSGKITSGKFAIIN